MISEPIQLFVIPRSRMTPTYAYPTTTAPVLIYLQSFFPFLFPPNHIITAHQTTSPNPHPLSIPLPITKLLLANATIPPASSSYAGRGGPGAAMMQRKDWPRLYHPCITSREIRCHVLAMLCTSRAARCLPPPACQSPGSFQSFKVNPSRC